MPDTLLVNEIFFSVQGEGTRAGMPCSFVRLTGCNLRCRYCDTEYAFRDGAKRTIDQIMAELTGHECDLVEITGGEPLLQSCVHVLMGRLCDEGLTVLVETSGASDISGCDPRVVRILDLKTPDSGECDRNAWANLDHLRERDELKFVICSRADYEWARDTLRNRALGRRVAAVLFSPVHETPRGRELPGAAGLPLRDLAEWILADRLPVRLQTQLHKQIWNAETRGV